MKKIVAVMAAALALAATQVAAQGGGGGAGGGGSGAGAGQGSGGTDTSAGGAGAAQATTAPGQQATTAPGQPSEVSGRVALVSAADGEIGIDAGTTTTQVKVAPDAQITVDGKRGSLKDIHQGAQIRASLERGEDGLQAKRVEVTSGAKRSGAK